MQNNKNVALTNKTDLQQTKPEKLGMIWKKTTINK